MGFRNHKISLFKIIELLNLFKDNNWDYENCNFKLYIRFESRNLFFLTGMNPGAIDFEMNLGAIDFEMNFGAIDIG